MTGIEELINRLSLSESVDPIEGDSELWLPIKDYEKMYYVSNLGRVISIKSKIMLKLIPDRQGSLKVNLTKDKKQKVYYIHRLVAQAFIPNPENLPDVFHINGVITDSSVENLRWSNQGESNKSRIVKGGLTLAKQGNRCYYQVQYNPNRDGKKKTKSFRISDPNNDESCDEAYRLALAFRDKMAAEINAQLPYYNSAN